MWTYAISPLVALSTTSRFLRTHSSYLSAFSEAIDRSRTSRLPAPAGEVATVTVTYSFSGLLRSCQ